MGAVSLPALRPDAPMYKAPYRTESPGNRYGTEEPKRFGTEAPGTTLEDPGTTLEEPNRFGVEPPWPVNVPQTPRPPDVAKPEPKQDRREKAELDAMAAKIAFQKRMAAKQGYAGTFHASEPTRSSVGPADIFRPPSQGDGSMMDRLKWSTNPVWLFGPRGPFSGVKLPDLNRGSFRLGRK